MSDVTPAPAAQTAVEFSRGRLVLADGTVFEGQAFGADATVTSFAIVVLGSLGNPLGTALGGIVYGVCYMMVQTFLSSWADLLPYVLLILILLLRPSGLLGRRVRVA